MRRGQAAGIEALAAGRAAAMKARTVPDGIAVARSTRRDCGRWALASSTDTSWPRAALGACTRGTTAKTKIAANKRWTIVIDFSWGRLLSGWCQ
jgi:hypothetical protein